MKKINPQALLIAKYLNEWLEYHVPSIKACSPHTKRNYETSVALYVMFLRSVKQISPKTLSAQCFSLENMNEWILWLKEHRSCSPATCNVRLSALRAFLKYMADKDIAFMTSYLQAETVPNQKTPKRKVVGLSKMAVNALFTVPNQRTTRGLRDYTLMLTLYSTAVRINELLSLKIGNIFTDGPKPRIIVIGKGRKKRPIPLLAKPVQYIKQYLTECHPNPNNPDALLFYSKSRGIYVPMSAENVNKLLKRYAAIAKKICKEVPLNLHAHQFRHAKASHWLENGMNIAQISYLLGHECIQTTMVYLDITTEHESKALETLENEDQRKLQKKWKMANKGGLEEFLGLPLIGAAD